jgi:hypothetical protein
LLSEGNKKGLLQGSVGLNEKSSHLPESPGELAPLLFSFKKQEKPVAGFHRALIPPPLLISSIFSCYYANRFFRRRQ